MGHLGWHHEVLVGDPGPAPRRPAPAEPERLDREWAAGQRRTEADLNRPLVVTLVLLGAVALLLLITSAAGLLPGVLALAGCLACTVVAIPALVALLQGGRAVRERLAEERRRLERDRAEREEALRARQEEHARRHAQWRERRQAYEAQPRWYGFTVPGGVGTVVVGGGTDAGWSALLTTIGAARLRGGADLTVLDLSGRAVGGDLVALARRCGVLPRLWVLPADLPRVNLGGNLDPGRRAAVLAAVVDALDPRADRAADGALLRGLLEVLGPGPAPVAGLVAALRALAAPEADAAGPGPRPLTEEQVARVLARFGAGTAAAGQAWRLARHLTAFEGLGTRSADEPYAQVKIIATDRSSGDLAGRAYGTYTLAALRELLEMRPRGGAGRPWAHTIVVCGAGALPSAELDRLAAAAADAGTGLVLLFRDVDSDVLERMRRPGCLPVLMRLPEGAAGDLAAELVGKGGRVRLHRLTEVIGGALDDTTADSYVPDPATTPTTALPTRYAARSIPPLDLARHVGSATAWGRATTQAAGIDDPGQPPATPPLRDLRLDSYGLRNLPSTAMVVAGDGGPVLVDANPGILTLPTATLRPVGDPAAVRPAAPAGSGELTGAANVGPPPDRLDWRRPDVG
ncbi:hypothetical protein DEF23_12315 [Marinitenerispora sediminis]|uniref:TraD/TraG TraM recognition site domain-containing protein n=1 Tax=Marinitenerispora sediminis TaxID=1931232 RepID=A0A368T7R8_9ACTN|nr:hypothetical protein DEF28_16280 [Marinitenerispora sediminis]RCV56593.1 hypothetical protein DEF23_12315 [Marinitenerispora sediminis]RCV60093.1 hypothetical protein DEF24_07935 [Marinitenerispora sediminis]